MVVTKAQEQVLVVATKRVLEVVTKAQEQAQEQAQAAATKQVQAVATKARVRHTNSRSRPSQCPCLNQNHSCLYAHNADERSRPV